MSFCLPSVCESWLYELCNVIALNEFLKFVPPFVADSTNHFPFASACHGSFHFLSAFCLLDDAIAHFPPSCAICIFPAFFWCCCTSWKGVFLLTYYPLLEKLKMHYLIFIKFFGLMRFIWFLVFFLCFLQFAVINFSFLFSFLELRK